MLLEVEDPPPSAGDKRHWYDPWVGKMPWRKAWQSTQAFLPGKSHAQRRVKGYSPYGRNESDTTEAT